MAGALFGWDLLLKNVESDIKNNEDILLVFTHLVLISNGFKCIGLGESKLLDGNETKSEALPAGWNECYALRYVHQGRLYNLKCTKLDDGIMVNLLRIDERTTSLVQLNSSAVANRTGSLEQMIPKHGDLANQIKTQLVDKIVVSKKSRETSSQTEQAGSPRGSVSSNRSPFLPATPLYSDPYVGPQRPVGVGEFDLHPFGRSPLGGPLGVPPGGGGMLFQPPGGPRILPPPNAGGLPPGAIPPGARFDPFRPPDVDGFPRRNLNRPDNDEMPPPGYDDMFM